MEILKLDINKLHADPNNAKEHPEWQVEQIKNSIETFGNLDPIGVWGPDNIIVEGHGRFLALKELGYNEVEVIRLDWLTEEERKAYALAHNKLTMNSGFDLDALKINLDEIGEIDMSLFGFNLNAPAGPDDIIEDEAPEVEEPEEEEEANPVCRLGDVWQLGDHRLICGDSTDRAVIDKLMDGQKADLVFTDPPYGMKKEKEGVLNDNLNFDDLLDFNRQWIPLTFEALKENGSWYCWGIDEPLMDIYCFILKPLIKAGKITFRNLITWKKENDNPTMRFNGACSSNNRSYYTNEKCLFVMCGVQGFNDNADHYDETFEPIRAYMEAEAKKVNLTPKKLKEICGVGMYSHWFSKSQFGIIPKEHYKKLQTYYRGEAFELEYDEMRNLFDDEQHQTLKEAVMAKRAYFDGNASQCIDVWVHDVTSQKEREGTGGHATPKPISLCCRGISSSSREEEIVLDVFGGSGSTLIACEQLNRKCYMCELDPRYCDVIIKRWEVFTGRKAVMIGGNQEETE